MNTPRMIALFLAALLILQPVHAIAANVDAEFTEPVNESDIEVPLAEPDPEEASEALPEDPTEESGSDAEMEEPFLPPEPGALGLDASGALTPTEALDLDAQAVLLFALDSDIMVYTQNPDQQREPASVTKIMTCLLALEYGGLYEEIEVTESALETMDPEGSSAELEPGDVYTLEELLYCLMVASANDASLVIAEYIGGSQEGFVEMMNAMAAELGCTGTHFANPHGLHAEDHYTTARDLARIFNAALEYDLFQTLISTQVYELPVLETVENEDGEQEVVEYTRKLYSTDYLISTDITDEYYDSRVIGGKTGFTTPAGRCVISLAEVNGMGYLAVVLGGSAWDAEDQPYYGSFVTVSALLDFAEHFSPVTVITAGQECSAPVHHGVSPARFVCDTDVTALLPQNNDPAMLTISLPEDLEAPLVAEDFAGWAVVSYNGVYLGHTGLHLLEDVEYRKFAVDPEQQLARHNALRRRLPLKIHGSVFLAA